MKAIVFKGPGKYAYEDRPIPEIKTRMISELRYWVVGICGTDLAHTDGPAASPRQSRHHIRPMNSADRWTR